MGKVVDFFDHPYYKFCKTMTSLVGQWPDQSRKELIFYRSVLFVAISLQLTPQFIAAYTYRNNLNILLDTFTPFIVIIIMLVKYLNNCFHSRTSTHLLNLIKENWAIFPRNNGQQLLHYHSNLCRKVSIIYLGAVYFGTFSFAAEPVQRRFMAGLLYGNTTVENTFALPMEFGSSFDIDYWYYPIFTLSTVLMFVIMTVVGSCDLLLIMYSEHSVGLFKALGYAIENLPPHSDSEESDFDFDYLKRCAEIHHRAICFAEHVRDIYLWTFFGIIGLNMIMMSITGVQVVLNKDALEKVIKYIVFVVMQSVHLFVECFAAQRLMDASYGLKDTLSNSPWYAATLKTQKLIPVMLMRSQSPIVLTAGKMIVMNMDTYATVNLSTDLYTRRKMKKLSSNPYIVWIKKISSYDRVK
nr:odorant receptor 49 [Psyttalia incisi]